MKAILVLFMAVLLSSFSSVDIKKDFVKQKFVDGELKTVQLMKLEMSSKITGVLTNLATDEEYLLNVNGDVVSVYEPAKNESVMMNPVPPGMGLSCTCCTCGCSFSTRMTSWGCVTCPQCSAKMGFYECIFQCGCGAGCTMFKIIE